VVEKKIKNQREELLKRIEKLAS
ncbi:MAG: hypothetical protein ACD_79C00561G0001, partial [uncultured bacterium]